MRKKCGQILCSLAVLACFAIPAAAQEITGTIQGVVTDESGARLPGVTVIVKHVETSQTSEVVSNEEGRFTVPYLRPGTYDVTFSLTGFQSVTQRGIKLSVNDRLEVNGSLKIGAITDTIEVVGSSTLIQ